MIFALLKQQDGVGKTLSLHLAGDWASTGADMLYDLHAREFPPTEGGTP
ncbi:hypothetical protein [Elioraea sp.]|nr:hypothetical protein [Elioraea sp.]